MPGKYRSKPLSKAQYKQVAKIANKQIHRTSELKTLDNNVSAIAVNSTAAVTAIVPPAAGSSHSTRDGDSLYYKSLHLRGIVDCDAAQDLTMRVIVFQWMENDATAPVVADILQDTAAGRNITSFYLKNPQKQFRIIDDSLYLWDSNVAQAPKVWSVVCKGRQFGRHKPDFDAGALTGNGNFYILTCSSTTAGAGAYGSLKSTVFRARFFDN